MARRNYRKIFRTVWFSFAAGFLLWNYTTFQSRNLPDDTFQSNAQVAVREDANKITFQAIQAKHHLEVIFFQGGLADPKAYGPLCRKIAAQGFTCHLIKMPWRLPQYHYQKISTLFDLKAGNYVLGGHSQGGKMAAQFVYENPGLLKGLFLLGTSHPRDIDLSDQPIACMKLYAGNDGLASVEEVLANKARLPGNTDLILVKGGNHSQFGYMGQLFIDNSADISLEQQQQITLDNLLSLFNKAAGTAGTIKPEAGQPVVQREYRNEHRLLK